MVTALTSSTGPFIGESALLESDSLIISEVGLACKLDKMTGCEKDGFLCYVNMRFTDECDIYKTELITEACPSEFESSDC